MAADHVPSARITNIRPIRISRKAAGVVQVSNQPLIRLIAEGVGVVDAPATWTVLSAAEYKRVAVLEGKSGMSAVIPPGFMLKTTRRVGSSPTAWTAPLVAWPVAVVDRLPSAGLGVAFAYFVTNSRCICSGRLPQARSWQCASTRA